MSVHTDPWTIRRLLEWTAGFFARKNVDSPRLSAELLLAHVLEVPRIKLYTDYDRILDEKHLAAFRQLVQRGGEHEPIAYLTGKAHFFNLEFQVTRDVLIPRPETETLVENVIQYVRHTPGLESPRVIDLCTGSGCIAASIAYHLKTAIVTATDISPRALDVAKSNLQRLGLEGRVLLAEGDLFEPLRKMVDVQPFDLVTANPPYIPTSKIASLDRNIRDFEPHVALDGGIDGLVLIRRILAESPARLNPGGRIFIEIQFDQGETVRQLASENPHFDDHRIIRDLSGHDRILTARRK